MMQSQYFQPSSWPQLHNYNYSLDHAGIYDFAMDTSILDHHDFSSSFTTEEDSSGISFDSYFATAIDPDTLIEFPSFSDEKQSVEAIMTQSMMDGIQIGEVCDWMDESDSDDRISSQLTSEADVWSPCPVLEQGNSSAVLPSNHVNLDLPGSNVESDNLLVLRHLLSAYGEATENGHEELSEVIVKRINERSNPFGQPIERVAFNLFQTTENQGGGYIRQQSSKNFETAFKAFYQCLPYGRFAHFAANSTILEAIPKVAENVHIVDFDMGEGIQWPPVIEAIAREGKKLRLTSIRLEDDGGTTEWTFEETKQRLCDHAQSLGLSIEVEVEEMSMDNLWSEIERRKKESGFREWVAFNCMVGLPHMGRRRTRTQVAEFLQMSKEVLANCSNYKGIIAFGDGEAQDNWSTTCPGYASSFNSHLIHYQALFESMEHNFPVYLSEARIAMESLFVAPYICSNSWFRQWDQQTGEGQRISGCSNWRINNESLFEAQELVNEKETSSYKVKIGGESENEMVLQWKGVPLVRVSVWG